ncbi:CLUMA_CG004204, isoform A [Clunio marinus]|uniref:CLUMA_CG004204, isoform A n=1 Tax=Clunio marinus TaxID=568069 RepID=A0A1J1HR35_9DIPT|nr:CLUMA_CG004204, isoform A [Clunio marinus]
MTHAYLATSIRRLSDTGKTDESNLMTSQHYPTTTINLCLEETLTHRFLLTSDGVSSNFQREKSGKGKHGKVKTQQPVRLSTSPEFSHNAKLNKPPEPHIIRLAKRALNIDVRAVVKKWPKFIFKKLNPSFCHFH